MRAFDAPGLVFDVPELFQDQAFIAWLENGSPKIASKEEGVWTQLLVLVDPSLEGEGSDSDMPEHCWEVILAACRGYYRPSSGPHLMVLLRNE